jgi:hypothetical protein
VENLENFFGIDRHRNRGPSAPINHGWDPPRATQAPCRILPEILTRLDFNSLNLGHNFLLLNSNAPLDPRARAFHRFR